jgi:hypothetical protein
MSGKDISLEYANTIMYDLQKAFWDERGKGARFRMTNVGREYFRDKGLSQLKTRSVPEIVEAIGKILQDEGIIASLVQEQDDRLLRLTIQGCLHHDVERRFVDKGVEPFTCVPANLVVMALEDALDRPVELAEIKVEDGSCALLLVLFDRRENP